MYRPASKRPLFALLVTAASAFGSGPAVAYCPTAETARSGFVLVSPRYRLEIQPSNDDMVTYKQVAGDQLQFTATHYKGIVLIRMVDSHGDTRTPSYDFDYTKEPPFAEGYHKLFRVTTPAKSGFDTATVETTVVGHEQISVGDCALDTFVLDGRTTYANGMVQKRRVNFSPLLRTFVRMTAAFGDAPPTTTVFDRIEPLAH